MKNGKALAILYSASKTYPLAAQTLQLLLEKGDKIWIQNYNTRAAELHDHNAFNVFSGVLITRMWIKLIIKGLFLILRFGDVLGILNFLLWNKDKYNLPVS